MDTPDRSSGQAGTASSAHPDGSTPIQGPKWERVALGHDLVNEAFQNGIFVDIAGHKRTFTDVGFSYSVFVRAYFHNAQFERCTFTGCRFYDCNFRGATFSGCDFKYVFVSNTILPFKELIVNAPEWPNLKREFMQILRSNAESVGDYDAQKAFIREEMEAKREHLRRARARNEGYYITHFKGPMSWITVRRDSFLLWLDRHLLGHGEHLGRAAFGSTVLLVLIGAILFLTTQAWSSDLTVSSAFANLWLCMKFSVYTLLDVPPDAQLSAPKMLLIVILLLRYFLIGLLVAALSRLVAHR